MQLFQLATAMAATVMAATQTTFLKILASYISSVASDIRSYTAPVTITLELLCLSPAEKRDYYFIQR